LEGIRLEKTEVRTATVSDVPIIAHIINEAWKSAYAGIVPQPVLGALSDEKKAAQLRIGLQRYPTMRYYLLEADGMPLGAASLHPTRDVDLPDAAEFSFFYFLPGVWRRGYGTILLHYLIHEAEERGYRQICCWVLEENKRAVAFYESQGMLRDGKLQTVSIGKDLTAVRYVMDLPFKE